VVLVSSLSPVFVFESELILHLIGVEAEYEDIEGLGHVPVVVDPVLADLGQIDGQTVRPLRSGLGRARLGYDSLGRGRSCGGTRLRAMGGGELRRRPPQRGDP